MQKQINLLKKYGAPEALIASFEEVCLINSRLPKDMRSDFSTLLNEQCRRFCFHDVLPDGWFFRPNSLDGNGRRHDGAVAGDEPEAAAIEQAYRRGVSQGFAICKQLVENARLTSVEKKEIKCQEELIDKWRKRSVQKYGSAPGSDEKPPRRLFGGRSSISNRLRWAVFERSGFRCVICGQGASKETWLEVDHINPVSKGGFDTAENLQTLCNRCNSGKSDT